MRGLLRWQYFIAMAVLLVGVGLSSALFCVFRQHDYERIREKFETDSLDHASAVWNTQEFSFFAIRTVAAFFDGSEEMTRREFSAFVAPLIKGHPSVLSIEWVPRVRDAQRAGPYPIRFVEPANGRVEALDIDLAGRPECVEAMNRSRDTGKPTATSSVRLPGATDDNVGVRLFLAVYHKNVPLDTAAGRRKHLEGFVVGVLSTKGIVEGGLSSLTPAGLDVYLIDSTDSRREQQLYFHRSRLNRSPTRDGDTAWRQSILRAAHTRDVAGRRWTVVCAAVPGYITMRMTWYPWVTAGFGLLMTGLLVAYLVSIATRNDRTVQLAAQLTESNRCLSREIVNRQQAEDRVTALLELSQMTDRSAAEIAKHAMESAIKLTGSTIGYLAFANEDESVLTIHYWSKGAMQQCAMAEKPIVYQVKDIGLCAEPIRQRKPIITNDYAAPNPLKKGAPPGHVPLTRHMNIPVFDGGRIVAIAGVGNKSENYEDSDVRQLTLFMDGMWRILCRKRAEEALRKSENLLSDLTAKVPGVVYQFYARPNGEMGLHYLSDSAEQISGLKPDLEGYFDRFTALVIPEYRDGFVKSIEKSVKESIEWEYEGMLQKPSGEKIWFSGKSTPSSRDNEIVFNGIITDITEKKQAELALAESKEKLQLLLNSTAEAIYGVDLHGCCTFCNPASLRLLGYAHPDDLLGKNMHAQIHHSHADGNFYPVDECRIFQAFQKEEDTHADDEVFWRKDGTSFPAEYWSHPQWRDGKIVGAVVAFVDITEHRQAERRQARSLRRVEGVNRLQEDLFLPESIDEKFKRITDAAVELLDLDFCRIWMIEPGDLCDRGCVHASTAEGPNACRHRDKCLHLRASSGRYTHTDGNHRRVPLGAYKIGRIANGETNKFLTNSVTTDPQVGDHQWAKSLGLVSFAGYKLRDANGEPIGVLAMFAKHPVSEEDDAFISNLAETTSRIILEQQVAVELQATKSQAVEASQAKSRFLANMSHEIRTPMTAILGYTDLLMDPAVSPSSRNNHLAVIRRSGEHLLSLINDILDLSKIEAGKFSLEMRRCSVVSLLADVTSMMRPRAEQRGVSLSIEYPGQMPETILTDGARLRQAVVNLVGNAVKFTEQGSVRIVASFLSQWHENRPAVRIEVIDTGIGIRPEVLPQLFQPFTQGDASVAQKFGGTGLGLAISRSIACLLGGDLTVTSAWGQGSTFTLAVPTGSLEGVPMLEHPAEAMTDSAGHDLESPIANLNRIRILLAEDGYDNRKLIETILRLAGAEVESVENGRLAVDKAEAESFDVVLMDINMPEMDGYEATRLLRDRGYDKPILALTANAMEGDSERCLAAGCNEHLAKPIDRIRLLRTIAAYVGENTAESQDRPVPTLQAPRKDGAIVSQFADDPEIAMILEEFVGCLEGRADAMRRAYADGRYEDLQRCAHRLKGAGGSYGYPSLTEANKRLEDAAKARDRAAAGAALDTVTKLIRTIQNGYSAATLTGRT